MTSTYPSQTFFLYLNIDVFPAAWAAYRGMLITPANYGTQSFRPISYWPYNLLRTKRTLRFQKEIELEQIRRKFYQDHVSRLHGIYLWGDEQSAKRGERWRGTEGNHFHADYLVEVGFTYNRLTKVDTNWIDANLLPDNVPLDRNCLDWMHSYWRGEAYPQAEPLWEYIAEGRGVVYGTTLRTQAYQKVKALAPESLGELELGRVAVEMGSDLYHLSPFIRQLSPTSFTVDFALDARDQNDRFMEKAGHQIKQIMEQDRTHINWEALDLLRGDTRRPDLRGMGVVFDCSEFSLDAGTLIESMVSAHDGSTWPGLTEASGAKLVTKHPDTP